MSVLNSIRTWCNCPADAIRWACILEATAPKAGNVFPGQRFSDLSYSDFVAAAEIAANELDHPNRRFSKGVLSAAQQTIDRLGTNVNLGILLLIGPLAAAVASIEKHELDRGQWQRSLGQILAELTTDDSESLYQAIRRSAPGGMNQVDKMDIDGPAPDDFLAAMRAAAPYDRIARNYCHGFRDLFETVVPLLEQSIETRGDLLDGIGWAQLRMLELEVDTLILRKFGQQVANEVRVNAKFDHTDLDERQQFDRFLRDGAIDLHGRASQINPGTTADLIAAALFILICTTC